MKLSTSAWLGLLAISMLGACVNEAANDDVGASSETGDGDGDSGEGDGDSGEGDGNSGDGEGDSGDGDGDDDGQPGDGDGDSDDGDGDGDGDGDSDEGDGDGDGDGDSGDGDGEPGDGDGESGDGDGDGDHDCSTKYENCGALMAAFQAETIAIRGCSEDSQCGQVLFGTSCGCTRDWVATLDADTECFYSLLEQAAVLECELGLISTCDCPGADGYVCDDGICNWNYW